MIHLFDGNNYTRALIEADATGEVPRSLFYKMMNPEARSVFVWDSLNGNKARRAIYSGYKAKRPDLTEDMYVGFDQIKTVLSHTHAIQIDMDGYEADDIIAALARHFGSKGEKVHIFSTDRDFLQLIAEYPNNITATSALKAGVLLSDIRYHKAIVGDTSDSIPGIKGFGDGAWEKADKPALKAWLDAVIAHQPPPHFDFGKAQETWVADEDNLNLLRSYWQIIGFLPISEEEIVKNFLFGKPSYAAGDAYLKGLLQ